METARDQAPGTTSSLIRTRCPSCQKLYAVDLTLDADSFFQCTDCEAQFLMESPTRDSNGDLEARSFPLPSEPTRTPTVAAPLKEPEAPELVTCPKCETQTSAASESCQACGLTFSKWVGSDEELIAREMALGAKPELIRLWKQIIDDYEKPAHHDAFLAACVKTDALAYGTYKYARILAQFPKEEIAQNMCRRFTEIAVAPLETAAAASPVRQMREEQTRPLRIPRFSSLAIVLGVIVLMMGLWIPGMKNMAGVGGAMLALTFGLRFFSNRARI